MKGFQRHSNIAGQLTPCLSSSSKTATRSPASRILCTRSLFSQKQSKDVETCAQRNSRMVAGLPVGYKTSRAISNKAGSSITLRESRSDPGQAARSTANSPPTQPIIHSIFEKKTGTWQYLVVDPSTLSAVIIDPVLDYDPVTQAITTHTADSLLTLAVEAGYSVVRILETHAHADHLTAAFYLQGKINRMSGHKPPTCIGKRIKQVQKMFGEKYGVVAAEYDGVFDKFLDDDETFSIGDLKVTALHLPGHTPDHLGYKIGDNVFCGDSIFHADIGSARCDFPGGSANDLFRSGRRLLALPDHVKIWTGHDYPPEDRTTPMAFMSVQDHRKQNKHLADAVTEGDFIHLRKERDAKLGEPRLLHQALQINIRGGRPPKPTALGHSFLHLPMKLKGIEW